MPPMPAIVYSPLELRQMEDDGNDSHCWQPIPASGIMVRGARYLQDGYKQPSACCSELLAVEFFQARQAVHGAAARAEAPTSTLAARSERPLKLVFAVNLILPSASGVYQVVFYFGIFRSDEASPADLMLDRFLNGSDAFRNARFKLIPSVERGSWLVKKAVGSRPAILGKALKQRFHASKGLFEVAIDCNSSPAAGRVVSLVKSYAKSLVVDLAFVVEAKTTEELPERVIGCGRLSHIDLDDAIPSFATARK